MSEYLLPQAGDIALTRNDSKPSSMLVKAQRAIRNNANFSHALISVNGSVWCHAVPSGIQLLTLSEAIEEELFSGQCKVIRHKDANSSLNGNRLKGGMWLDAMAYYFGQKYNYAYFLPKGKKDRSSFCSELVVKIYIKAVPWLDLGVGKGESVTPADLEALADLDCWDDITAQYKEYYSLSYDKDDGARELDESFKQQSHALCQEKAQLADNLLRTMDFHIESSRLMAHVNKLPGVTSDNVRSKLERLEELLISSRAYVWGRTEDIDRALKRVRKELKKLQ